LLYLLVMGSSKFFSFLQLLFCDFGLSQLSQLSDPNYLNHFRSKKNKQNTK
jgi:hypothetical protein